MTIVADHPDSILTDRALDAEHESSEAGMARDRFLSGSGGGSSTSFVPLCRRESASAYALRAAGEILSRYLVEEE